MNSNWKYLACLFALSLMQTNALASTIASVSDPTSKWNTIPGVSLDPVNDQQTGQEDSDIVGIVADPAFYSATDGTNIYYRVRLGASSNGGNFSGLFWVGIDANNDGALDLFIGVNNQGSTKTVGFYAPGTNTNTSPSTTSIQTGLAQYQLTETATDYNYQTVNSTIDPTLTNSDLDAGGKTDVFLSFMLPYYGASGTATLQGAMAGLASIAINGSTTFKYVIATSTQANSLNQDLGGVPKSYVASSTWAQLGAISPLVSPNGTVVGAPEPGSSTFVAIAAIFGLALAFRRQQKRRAATRA